MFSGGEWRDEISCVACTLTGEKGGERGEERHDVGVHMKWKSHEIAHLLRAGPEEIQPPPPPLYDAELNVSAEGGDGDGDGDGGSQSAVEPTICSSCDVSYVMFLEPVIRDNPNWSWTEWVADRAIRIFSPDPTMAHVELVVPPIPNSAGGKVHFATYLGAAGANWQNRSIHDEGIEFYLVENGTRWRAIPVFAPSVAESMRHACDANLHAPYSIGMYATSARPLRGFSWMYTDEPKHMGHCATITSRILKEAGVGSILTHNSAWYCPSSLYNTLSRSLGSRLDETERAAMSSARPEACRETVDALLHGPLSYATVRDLGDAKCVDAVRALTLNVCNASSTGINSDAARTSQKELASALLRWVLLRYDKTVPD